MKMINIQKGKILKVLTNYNVLLFFSKMQKIHSCMKRSYGMPYPAQRHHLIQNTGKYDNKLHDNKLL